MLTQVFHWCVRKKNVMTLMNWRITQFSCVCFLFLFSATWPAGVRRLAKSYLKNPMIVYVGTLDLAVSCSVLLIIILFYLWEEPTVKSGNILLVDAYNLKINLNCQKTDPYYSFKASLKVSNELGKKKVGKNFLIVFL